MPLHATKASEQDKIEVFECSRHRRRFNVHVAKVHPHVCIYLYQQNSRTDFDRVIVIVLKSENREISPVAFTALNKNDLHFYE